MGALYGRINFAPYNMAAFIKLRLYITDHFIGHFRKYFFIDVLCRHWKIKQSTQATGNIYCCIIKIAGGARRHQHLVQIPAHQVLVFKQIFIHLFTVFLYQLPVLLLLARMYLLRDIYMVTAIGASLWLLCGPFVAQ
jgi:hypothetical protein